MINIERMRSLGVTKLIVMPALDRWPNGQPPEVVEFIVMTEARTGGLIVHQSPNLDETRAIAAEAAESLGVQCEDITELARYK